MNALTTKEEIEVILRRKLKTGGHDLMLELTNESNVKVVCSVTSKIWDLVDKNIDELTNAIISVSGTIKALGDKSYKLNRPSKIKRLQ